MSDIVLGVQWGDEGKGKIIDILAAKSDVVVRSQGGNNAGHTVVSNGTTYKLHLVPSGILYEGVQCYIGAGVVLDPKSFTEELGELGKSGVTTDRLVIDYRAHIVMPWHIELDGLAETYRGGADIGTTKKGIGPAYADKYERSGLRLFDLINPDIFRKKAKFAGELKNKIITAVYGGEALDVDSIIEEYIAYGEILKPLAGDVSELTFNAYKNGKKILFEGAQATLLDIDFGTYPYVTSSHPVSGGVFTGTGIGPSAADGVIGIAKAYTTRVGKGPFPTELDNKTGDDIRTAGGEYGTTTGRPRRIGWFDSVIVRHSVRINGVTNLAINKLDTLRGIETLKIAVAYEKNGTVIKEFPPDIELLGDCTPIYEEYEGFTEDISGCRNFEDLPENCKKYIIAIENSVDTPVSFIGVGPDRQECIFR